MMYQLTSIIGASTSCCEGEKDQQAAYKHQNSKLYCLHTNIGVEGSTHTQNKKKNDYLCYATRNAQGYATNVDCSNATNDLF